MIKENPFDFALIEELQLKFGTPFYIYDEKTLRERAKRLKNAFRSLKFKEFFAVKATPTAKILQLMYEEGFGMDVATITELMLCERCGISGENILYTSNGTTAIEFSKIKSLNGIVNIDDISLLDELCKDTKELPSLLSFRINPGDLQTGNFIMGSPTKSKFGITMDQVIPAYEKALSLGIKRFGIHTMVGSNVLEADYFLNTVKILLDIANSLKKRLKIEVEFINIGGGFGIPYKPEEEELNIEKVAALIEHEFKKSLDFSPKLFMEHGRWLTGPAGYLVSQVVSKKEIYKNYVILDASMSDLMRPALYNAYHHISTFHKNGEMKKVDIVGTLCENNDRFAIDRSMPELNIGDYVIIHDSGAHGHSMGFNYNGKLRSPEILLKEDGTYELIQRRQTFEDYIQRMEF